MYNKKKRIKKQNKRKINKEIYFIGKKKLEFKFNF